MNNHEKYRNAYSVIEPSADFTTKVLKEAEKMNQKSHSKAVFERFSWNKGIPIVRKRVALFAAVLTASRKSPSPSTPRGWKARSWLPLKQHTAWTATRRATMYRRHQRQL